jgi:ATP-dependent 26S proteasome regulatory subunit
MLGSCLLVKRQSDNVVTPQSTPLRKQAQDIQAKLEETRKQFYISQEQQKAVQAELGQTRDQLSLSQEQLRQARKALLEKVAESQSSAAEVERLKNRIEQMRQSPVVFGTVTAVSQTRADLCEVRFNTAVDDLYGRRVMLYRGYSPIGILQVVATSGQDLVGQSKKVRAQVGDFAFPAPDWMGESQ